MRGTKAAKLKRTRCPACPPPANFTTGGWCATCTAALAVHRELTDDRKAPPEQQSSMISRGSQLSRVLRGLGVMR